MSFHCNANLSVNNFAIDYDNSTNVTFDISQIAKKKYKADELNIESDEKSINLELTDCEYISENQVNIDFKAGFSQFASLLNALERNEPE